MKLTKEEIMELVHLDGLCFEPPICYTYRDVTNYIRRKGATLLRKRKGEKLIAFCLGDSSDGNIITVDIHPDYRRQGLGRQLLSEMLEKFRALGVSKAVSQIALDNIPSLSLHKSLGFEIRHILYGYYPDGSGAFELVLPLTPEGKS